MKTTHFAHGAVLLHYPSQLKPDSDTNLFCHTHQSREKQLLTQFSFMAFTV